MRKKGSVKEGKKKSESVNSVVKLCIWNSAGVINKDKDTWEYLKSFDIIGLVETWVEEKDWKKMEKRLPKGYKWKCCYAKRESKRGRAKGGIITGVKISEIIESEKYKEWSANVAERKVRIKK